VIALACPLSADVPRRSGAVDESSLWGSSELNSDEPQILAHECVIWPIKNRPGEARPVGARS